MMKPLTFAFEFNQINDAARPVILRELAEHGCRHIVLSNYFLGEFMKNPSFADTVSKELREYSLSFCDGHGPFGPAFDLFLPESEARHWMLACQALAIETAARHGVQVLALHTGDRYDFTDPFTQEELHENIIRSLEFLLPIAERCGIILALENTYYPPNSADRLVALAKYFSNANFGLCYDAGHGNLLAPRKKNQKIPPVFEYAFEKFDYIPWDGQMLEKMLPYVVCCHLHDNNGERDQHLLMDDPQGTVDWAHIMGLLGQAPRLNSFQCEALPVRERIPIARLVKVFSSICTSGYLS